MRAYTIEHTRVWFKEWLTFKFVEILFGKFPAYKESSCYVICMPWVENFIIKVYWVRIGYEVEKDSLWTEKQNYFTLPEYQLI